MRKTCVVPKTFWTGGTVLDRNGYRPNVCIVLVNDEGRVFWGKRISEHAWQFPQGGVRRGETLWHAALRELYEEVGLRPGHVEIIGRTEKWLYYDVPAGWVRNHRYKGQKQIWFLLRLTGSESDINLQTSDSPEFDAWEWIDYWSPIEKVIDFKRLVYQKALQELSSFLPAQKNLQPLADSLRSSS